MEFASNKRRRAVAVAGAALAAVLLTGCGGGDGRADRDGGKRTSSGRSSTEAPVGAGTGNPATTDRSRTDADPGGSAAVAEADEHVTTTDGLLGQLDGPIEAGNQAPQDGDG
jgi:hypothetical protein